MSAGRELCNLHDLPHCADPAQHIIVAGQLDPDDPDDLDRDLPHV